MHVVAENYEQTHTHTNTWDNHSNDNIPSAEAHTYNIYLSFLAQGVKQNLEKDRKIFADLPGWLASESPLATLPADLSSSSDRPDIRSGDHSNRSFHTGIDGLC